MVTKSQLGIGLSKLKLPEAPKSNLEQYNTDAEIASSILWNAYMLGDVEGKRVADLGAGSGVLGIGCIELEAEKVDFVEVEESSFEILKQNLSGYENYQTHFMDVEDFDEKVDTVVMNPPFGVQKRKADKKFVEKAFEISNVVYYIGKIESDEFINSISNDHGKEITHKWSFDLLLKNTMKYHKKKRHYIKIGCWRIV